MGAVGGVACEGAVGGEDGADDGDVREMGTAAGGVVSYKDVAGLRGEEGGGAADAFAEGRKVRVTKVPFVATARALIDGDPRGFVKIVSDPATGVILGGSIVGRHAAELISVLAVAVTNGLRANDLAESLFVHPALSEALSEAAE